MVMRFRTGATMDATRSKPQGEEPEKSGRVPAAAIRISEIRSIYRATRNLSGLPEPPGATIVRTMPDSSRILAFAGSSRRDSWNRKLLGQAVRFARETGAEVTEIDLADFVLPLYNGDEEAASGLPDAAKQLKSLMVSHDRFLIASPEYNSSITPLLKNVIDWCSRPESEDEPALKAYTGKVAGLIAASPGGLGGLRGLRHLREILGNIGVHVVPAQFALSSAHQAFDEAGSLTASSAVSGVRKVVDQLVSVRLT